MYECVSGWVCEGIYLQQLHWCLMIHPSLGYSSIVVRLQSPVPILIWEFML